MTTKVGHYELLAEFASGGMATVHFGRLVRAGGFSKVVAIKRLRPTYAHDEKIVRMLLDEARLTAMVAHPNVVPTLDVVATTEDVFVVMEYVRGDSLAKILAALRTRRERMPPRIVAAVVPVVIRNRPRHPCAAFRGLFDNPPVLLLRDRLRGN